MKQTRAGDCSRDPDPAPSARAPAGWVLAATRHLNAGEGMCRRGRGLRGLGVWGQGLRGRGLRDHVTSPVPSAQIPPDADASSQKGPGGEVAFAQGPDTSDGDVPEGRWPCPRREQSPPAPRRWQPARGRTLRRGTGEGPRLQGAGGRGWASRDGRRALGGDAPASPAAAPGAESMRSDPV